MTDADETSTGRVFDLTPARLAAILDHVSELVLCCDTDGTIRFASPSVRTLLGFDASSLVGKNVVDFLDPAEVEGIIEGLARWAGRRGAPHGEVLHVRTVDGTYRPMEYDTVHGADLGMGGDMVATLRPQELVDPNLAELRQRLRNDDRIVRLASAFLHGPVKDFEKGLQIAVEELSTLEWVTRVSVWRAEGDRLRLRASWDAPMNAPALPVPTRVRIGDLRFLQILAAGEEVHITAPWDLDESWARDRQIFEAAGSQEVFGEPLMSGGEFLGIVIMESAARQARFGTVHASALRSAAAILAEAFARYDAERLLAEQARTDRVTGLGNRWAFDEALDRELNAVSAGTSPGFGMAILDIDRFKLVNDSLGHLAGDRLLADVATRLSGAATPGTVLSRLGGDELLILIPDSPGPQATMASIEALAEALRVPFDVGGNAMVVTASVGALHESEGDTTVGELLRWVDLAVHRAKEQGGDTVEMDLPSERPRQTQRMRRVAELRRALAQGEFRVHYQGEWSLDSGDLVGAEALVRWEHPQEGLLAAGDFVPLAEASGLMTELGHFVVSQACRDAAPWVTRLGPDKFVLRVNVAAHQLRGSELVESVADALADSGLSPSALCLELTETTLLADPIGSAVLFAQLRDMGVGLAIDDFGTGYSSILQLKRLPLTALKIDRAFVMGLPDDASDRAIVRATLELAAALGIAVTAEGVETEAQRTALWELGCRHAQGFLLARPEPADSFAERVDAQADIAIDPLERR